MTQVFIVISTNDDLYIMIVVILHNIKCTRLFYYFNKTNFHQLLLRQRGKIERFGVSF